MKKLVTLLMVMIAILVGGEPAQAYTFTTGKMYGAVGNYSVTMVLTVNTSTGRVSGWYYYDSKGSKNKIQLSGTMRGEPMDGASMTLTETVKGKKTGTFKGSFWLSPSGSEGYNGTWSSPSGKRLEFDVMHMVGGY